MQCLHSYSTEIEQTLSQLWLQTNTPEFQKQWKTVGKVVFVSSIVLIFSISGGWLLGSGLAAGALTHLAVCKVGAGVGCLVSAMYAAYLSRCRTIDLWGNGSISHYLKCLAPRIAYIFSVSIVGCWCGINPLLSKNVFILGLTGLSLSTIPLLDNL